MLRFRDNLLLLVVLTATVLAGAYGQLHERIDVENRAMKSDGTVDAEIAARRSALFGDDHAVVLLLEPRTQIATEESDAEIGDWLRGLRRLGDVAGLEAAPASDAAGARLVVIDVRCATDGTYAAAVRGVVASARRTAPPTHRLWVSGQPVGEIAIAEALIREQAQVVPAIGLVLLLLLMWCYRGLTLAIAGMLPSLAGIAWIGGLQAMVGMPIDPASSLLAPVLLTVGVAGSVHVLEAFTRRVRRGESCQVASRGAIYDLLSPATLAVLTTIAGFLGLLASPIPAVRHFGLLAAVGVAITATLALLVVPAFLRRFGRSAVRRIAADRREPWRLLGPGAAAWLRHHRRSVVAAGAALTLLATAGVRVLHVDTDPLRVLATDDPFRVATEHVADAVGGSEVFDLLLEQPVPSAAWARALLVQGQVGALDGVVGPARSPRTAVNGERLLGFVVAPGGSTEREQLFRRAEEIARAAGFETAHATGSAVRVARDSQALVHGQLRGLAVTLLLLWLAMALGFRSIRLASLGLLPNLLPCLVLYGGMGLVGRPLSVGSAMIGSVMLGLVVDDSIHFLHGYHASRCRGRGRTTSVARALHRSGRAITRTTLVLTAGFLAGLLGSLETTREFGVLAASTVAMAWLADLVLLPSLLLGLGHGDPPTTGVRGTGVRGTGVRGTGVRGTGVRGTGVRTGGDKTAQSSAVTS